MKKTILFKGFYGFRNIGDDIFVLVAEYIAEKYWDSKAIFIGNDLPETMGKSIKLSLKKRELCRLAEMIGCFFARKIVIFGGSTISRIGGIKKLYFWIDRLKILSEKTSIIGVSIMIPGKVEEKNQTIDFLKKMKMVAVRDIRSEKELKEYGIETVFSFDPAIVISDIFPELQYIERERDTLGICMCVNSSEETDVIVDRTISFLMKVALDCGIKKIIFFRFYDSDEDKYLCEELICKCNGLVEKVEFVDYTPDIKSFCEKLAKCNMIFGSKLHAGIIAYSLQIPFMLDEYHKKCTDFLNTINHKYRFERDKLEVSASNFKTIWESNQVLNIVEPLALKQMFYKAVITYRDKIL